MWNLLINNMVLNLNNKLMGIYFYTLKCTFFPFFLSGQPLLAQFVEILHFHTGKALREIPSLGRYLLYAYFTILFYLVLKIVCARKKVSGPWRMAGKVLDEFCMNYIVKVLDEFHSYSSGRILWLKFLMNSIITLHIVVHNMCLLFRAIIFITQFL